MCSCAPVTFPLLLTGVARTILIINIAVSGAVSLGDSAKNMGAGGLPTARILPCGLKAHTETLSSVASRPREESRRPLTHPRSHHITSACTAQTHAHARGEPPIDPLKRPKPNEPCKSAPFGPPDHKVHPRAKNPAFIREPHRRGRPAPKKKHLNATTAPVAFGSP